MRIVCLMSFGALQSAHRAHQHVGGVFCVLKVSVTWYWRTGGDGGALQRRDFLKTHSCEFRTLWTLTKLTSEPPELPPHFMLSLSQLMINTGPGQVVRLDGDGQPAEPDREESLWFLIRIGVCGWLGQQADVRRSSRSVDLHCAWQRWVVSAWFHERHTRRGRVPRVFEETEAHFRQCEKEKHHFIW